MYLRDDPLRAAEMGKWARAMLDACFARKIAFARWQGLLGTVSNPAESATCASP